MTDPSRFISTDKESELPFLQACRFIVSKTAALSRAGAIPTLQKPGPGKNAAYRRLRDVALSWQAAGGTSAGLALASLLSRRSERAVASEVLRDAATPLWLFALWQATGKRSAAKAGPALRRAAWIRRAESAVGLPDELAWQRRILGRARLVSAANRYYAVMHGATMASMLLWVFVRHRQHYCRVKATVVLVTLACLLVQLVPVAPPRMLTQHGFVDVAAQYGQSIFRTESGNALLNEFSAIPSVHVAWCILVAAVVMQISDSRWKWLGVAHAITTVVVVIVTANHFWADGIAATGLVLLVHAVQRRADERNRSKSWCR